jgi:hypothetical protein
MDVKAKLILLSLLLACLTVSVKCESTHALIHLVSSNLNSFNALKCDGMQRHKTCPYAGNDDDDQRQTPAGGLNSSDSEATMMGNKQNKIFIKLCFRRNCQNTFGSCYCCGTLPHTPCYLDQKKCWNICPSRQQTPTLGQLVAKSPAYPRFGALLPFCDIC